MGKITTIKYDLALHWLMFNDCIFECEYCIARRNDNHIFSSLLSRYRGGKLREIDSARLLDWFRKLKKKFCIHFTGGEPFLAPKFISSCKVIIDEHFIGINTNLVTGDLNLFAQTIPFDRVEIINASFHGPELFRKGLVQRYVENYLLLRDNSFTIEATIVAYPGIFPKIMQYVEYLTAQGIKPIVRPYYGMFNDRHYPQAYTDLELRMYNIEQRSSNSYGVPCLAGYKAVVVFDNDYIYPCYHMRKKIGKLYSDIKLNDHLINCPVQSCSCPLWSIHNDML